MSKLSMTVATGYYDRVLPLRLGDVEPEGIDLNYLTMPVEEALWRMVRFQEFDASEMSLGAYVTMVGRGDCPFVAIPVFPSRFFRHSSVFVHAGSGLRSLEDLRGRRVGIPQYAMTAVVWMRGALQHDYGVPLEEVCWVQGGLNHPHTEEKVKVKVPARIQLEPAPDGRSLGQMLEAGEISALFCARAPQVFLNGSPHVTRLYPDFRTAEMEYYRRTGIFPIMHTLVIQKAFHQRHPWVARSLYNAFVEARRVARDHLFNSTGALPVMLPWLLGEVEEERRFFGDDLWPYGLEANRKTLETFTRYVHEHGLTRQQVDLESLFPASTR